jgi:hypothetical protein
MRPGQELQRCMSPAQSNGFTRSAIATMAMCGLLQWARTLTGRRPVWKGRKKTEETGYGFGPSIRRADSPISMLPLKKAPSPILMRCVITSPIKELSLRMSTRSLASMLPRTLPRTTTSRAEMFAATCASRLTVTLPPGWLIEPSTFPSMYNQSEHITSPLISRLLAIMAGPAAIGNVGEVREALITDASMLAVSEGERSIFFSPVVVNAFVLNQHILPYAVFSRLGFAGWLVRASIVRPSRATS